jgi:hypothetical protein
MRAPLDSSYRLGSLFGSHIVNTPPDPRAWSLSRRVLVISIPVFLGRALMNPAHLRLPVGGGHDLLQCGAAGARSGGRARSPSGSGLRKGLGAGTTRRHRQRGLGVAELA